MQPSEEEYKEAVQCLRKGQTIAYPTEAVYGLGCDPYNREAVLELLKIKNRSVDKGFILVASSWEQIESLVQPITPQALAQVFSTWPGPVTWVFPAHPNVPYWIRGRHSGIALRISAHPVVQHLCNNFGGPIVSTSANLEHEPPARHYRTVEMIFPNQLGMILRGDVSQGSGISRPTMIRDALSGEILRN